MAGQTYGLNKSYLLEDDNYSYYAVVVRGTDPGWCKIADADNQPLLGTIQHTEVLAAGYSMNGSQAGRAVPVDINGISKAIASGKIAYGDEVIVAAGGKIKKCPTVAGTYNIAGISEGIAADGDVIVFTQQRYIKVIPA